MSTLLFTLGIAFLIVIIAIGLLAIGWILTGRSRITPGACGQDPTKTKDNSCGTTEVSCGLCKKEEKKNN